ncbi:DUF748 domain-containing protein [Pseudoduganella namucuonensis]|uniref:DUF748 domain-containing protein n=1 Tax=Pseudoduganella namucuonensis TaxID=1035707 RepID=A0A1I7JRM1_9BURK|nr:DUF748 domain-containing protein [Pseudoduganella namucuonensis]SFU87770.1 protein of unknown function [Pseudoduganella namucuonensis]
MKKVPLKLAVPGAIAGLALAYSGIGFLAVPAIVKSQAQRMAQEKLHRQLTIEKVAFNPFTLAMSVHGLKMMEPRGGAVFASFDTLSADLSWQSLRRLAPVVEEVRLLGPHVRLARLDDNRYSIDDILALLASEPPSPEPARFSVNNIQLEGGRFAFDDKPAGALHEVEGLTLGLPFISSMPADVQVFVEPLLRAKVNGAPLLVKGRALPYAENREYSVSLDLDDLNLPRLLGYLPFKPAFKLAGSRLDARLTAQFRQPKAGASSLLLGGEASVRDLDLRQVDGKPVLKFAELSAKLGKLDVFAQRYELERVALDGMVADVNRDSQGRLNLDTLAQSTPSARPAATAAASPPAAAPTASAAPYVSLKELAVSNAALRYADATPQQSLRAGLEKFNLSVREVVADIGKRSITVGEVASDSAKLAFRQGRREAAAPEDTASANAPYRVSVARLALKGWSLDVEDAGKELAFAVSPLQLSVDGWSNAPASRSKVDLKATLNKTGQLSANGTLALAPFGTDLALELKNLDLLPLQPYVTDYVNLRVTQGAVSAKGKLLLDGAGDAIKGGYQGDFSVNRLATVDKNGASDFLSWKALSFGGVDMRLQPFALDVDKVALSDFFARVIIDPSGRINAQDVMRTAANEDSSLTDAGTRAQAPGGKRGADGRARPSRPAPKAAPAQQAAAPMPPIRIGQLALSGGRVRFTDNFIRPNYTANLKELGGTVSGLSSDPAHHATVDLRGAVNSAPLAIGGRIHPLKRDLSLDLKAEVRGMELAALSAYADKYVGYGIEKGKLSFEVAYRLEDRKLTADNRLILDQLTFGAASTNPEASRLPVQMAVALLSDRNGVIDINVPVGGSLDDPKFSVGGIVLTIIGNAVVKTVTAPFTFIASLFGGEELSTLDFEHGAAAISPEGEARLAKLAKALTERPGLKLDVAGGFDPAADLAALKRNAVERKLRTQKTRELQARGAEAPEGGVTVTKEERAALLARVYAAETFDKPRNALGLRKGLPPEEMEALLLAHTSVDEDDLIALGNRRSQAAKDWLAKQGRVPVERIFVVASRAGGKEAASRVEFALR